MGWIDINTTRLSSDRQQIEQLVFSSAGRGTLTSDKAMDGWSVYLSIVGEVSDESIINKWTKKSSPGRRSQEEKDGSAAGSGAWDFKVQTIPGFRWRFVLECAANKDDFPLLFNLDPPIARSASTSVGQRGGEDHEIYNLPYDDLQSMLTGAYASAAGCLRGAEKGNEGLSSTSLYHPLAEYSENFNFFDPDNFLTMTSLIYMGDEYLMRQVQGVIENNMNNIKGGQLPHHFIGGNTFKWTYQSIASSTQPGPNIFWLLTAFTFAAHLGRKGVEWLMANAPLIRAAGKYLIDKYDHDVGLFKLNGPLWIDVCIREGYTSDTNAIMPLLLRRLAEFETVLYRHHHHQNSSSSSHTHHRDDGDEFFRLIPEAAIRHLEMAKNVSINLRKRLWAADKHGDEEEGGGDHLISFFFDSHEEEEEETLIRKDFVDYDSNLLAVAFANLSRSDSEKILGRIDGGAYSHPNGISTYCCETPYDGYDDCYIKERGTICGDSVVTMGRIAWADAHARKRLGRTHDFDTLILDGLQQRLNSRTWLHERFDKYGKEARSPFYFEYPALATILLREVRYGVNIGLTSIEIDPLLTSSSASSSGLEFHYHIGNVHVDFFNWTHVRMQLPAFGHKDLVVTHLKPDSTFNTQVIRNNGRIGDANDHKSEVISIVTDTNSEGKLRIEAVHLSLLENDVIAISLV
mmetsp:Transcript_5721/g.8865  ORF Transcript_5721/g.8865 Transcript_5721/m.8865 type:complete len:687 (+) Transcript_5721:98-2158(+)